MGAVFLTFRVLFVSILITLFLPFRKLPTIVAWIESKQSREVRLIEDENVKQMINIVNKVARFQYFLIRNNCLKKSLLFYYFLLQYGVKNIQIHIGVYKDNVQLKGHCWLIINDKLFLDNQEEVAKYAVIYSSGV